MAIMTAVALLLVALLAAPRVLAARQALRSSHAAGRRTWAVHAHGVRVGRWQAVLVLAALVLVVAR